MFDVLVESNSVKGRGAKQSAYFGTTALVLGTLFVGLFVYSLFHTDLGYMSGDDLSADELVAPVVADEAPPPPPAPENKPQKQVAQPDAPKNFDVRPVLQRDINETPTEINKVSTTQNNVQSRREGVPTVIGTKSANATGGDSSGIERGNPGGNTQAIATKPQVVKNDPDDPPPAPTPKPKPPSVVSGGVINGKARNLVQPPYPAAAKAVHASGTVNVQVLIDEAGNVVSASATSGNPLLRAAAVQAARSSKFTPTQLSGQPVKVSGIIVYNFVAQ